MSRLCVLVCASFIAALAEANDGWMGVSGTPMLMGSHPTVQMVSEKVTMTIRQDYTDVDCRFVFKNHGAAVTVRMGFPDTASPPDDPDIHNVPLQNFKSYVDGRAVKTYLIFGRNEGWRIKHVRFSSGQVRNVRNTYRVRMGRISTTFRDDKTEQGSYGMRTAGYQLHTGASWKGQIERSEVIVSFAASSSLRGRPIRIEKMRADYKGFSLAEWKTKHPNTVIQLTGPCMPVAKGNTLRYVRTKWKPTEGENISILFHAGPSYVYGVPKGTAN